MQTDGGQRGSADHLQEEDPDEPGAHESGDGHDDTDVAEDEPAMARPPPVSFVRRICDRAMWPKTTAMIDPPVRPKTNEAIAKAFMVRITVGVEG